jgi:hypothetical protein
MLCRATVVFSILALATAAIAQTSPVENNQSTTTDSSNSMDPPQVGDHWTYELRDEITGTLKSTLVNVITQVSPSDIAIRIETLGTPGYAYFGYDHSWNLKDNSVWKYSPGDGTGIKTPLKVGSNWNFQSADSYAVRGASFKRSGSSKVVAQESITTAAGTFDTFKIETAATSRNANDPTKKTELLMTTWYAPSVDHWVKRTSKVTLNGHVDEDASFELVEYGRR